MCENGIFVLRRNVGLLRKYPIARQYATYFGVIKCWQSSHLSYLLIKRVGFVLNFVNLSCPPDES